MNFELNDSTLKIKLNGRVDSTNANDVSLSVDDIISKNPHQSLVLDVENLEYISSAGLRLMLKLIKDEKSFSIINASSEVYEIFDMTGFTQMTKIEKAYKKVSVDGCEIIGQGANGKVYRLDPETIIKVFINPNSLQDIQNERDLARKAFVLGIPTAISYDIVKVGEGYGSVYELLNANSLAKLIANDEAGFDKYIDLYVDLLKKIHGTTVKVGDMPDMKSVAISWVEFLQNYLPENTYNKLHALVEDVPSRLTMLHGDYHVKNVMVQNGDAILIDMDTLCYGDPVFEFASIYNAYLGYSENNPKQNEIFLGIKREVCKKIWDETLRRYFGTDDKTVLEEYEKKAMAIGYVRIMRRTIRRNGFDTEEGRRDIETAKKHIIELVDEISSLKFKE